PIESLKITSEVALSQFDQNRFSSLDDSDNEDWALFQKVEHKTKQDWAEIQTTYALKYSGEQFRNFDRPEEVDFQRKWNLNQFVITEQVLQDISTNWRFSKQTNYSAEFGLIQRKDMNGWRGSSLFQTDE